jgi:kojibiose phosphorylase
MNNLWRVRTEKFINEKEAVMRSGNVYQIANGYMGYRGTLDEFGPEQLVGITLAGLFDRVGNAWREPVNAPNGGFTEVTLGVVKMSALTAKIKSHRQSLNLENAVFERETTFSARGKNLTLKSSRFLSAADPHLGVIQFSVTCDHAAKVVIRTGIDFNIWDLNGPHLLRLTSATRDGMLLVQGITNEAAKRVAVAEALTGAPGKETQVTSDRKQLHVIRLDLEAGKTYAFQKFFSVYSDNDRAKSPGDAALRCVREAKSLGYAACLALHNAEWAKRWARCDVVIEGDPEAQLALRFSIFQLLIVAPVAGSANSIPARALSGQVYKGAIFWDTEMFMFPFFLHTQPETAAELLRYRIRTLAGARRKARTEGTGFRGAFYAWESQETGDEACTYFNIGDPVTGRDLRTYFRDKQVHISGDIAVAMWAYFQLTGDDSLLLAGGAEVILECARFYYSYAYWKPEKNRCEILDVTGPDEYHERVNNNAFTSMAAKATFEIANATIAFLKRKHPAELAALLGKIKIAGELPQFAEAAKLLYVPPPDPRTGVIEQFDGYFRLEDTTVEAVKARKIHPDEYLGGGQGVAVQTRVIKQADVVMMLNLFKDRFSKEVKQANWEYYEPRTEHGSSLSACAYAMVAADIGKLDWAYKYFLQTATIDLEAKYKVYVGTIFMGGSHPAANGGAWMTAVFGFGGLTATENQITLQPRLYKKWRLLKFHVVHRGDQFRIGISRNSVRIDAAAGNRLKHKFVVAGKTKFVVPGANLVLKY